MGTRVGRPSQGTKRSRVRVVPVTEDRWADLPVGTFARVDAADREPRGGVMFYLWYPETEQRAGFGAFVLCRGELDSSIFESDALHWRVCFGSQKYREIGRRAQQLSKIRTGDMIPDGYFRELIVGRVLGALEMPKGGENGADQ